MENPLIYTSRFGRRWTTILCHVIVAIGGTVAGVVQSIGKFPFSISVI